MDWGRWVGQAHERFKQHDEVIIILSLPQELHTSEQLLNLSQPVHLFLSAQNFNLRYQVYTRLKSKDLKSIFQVFLRFIECLSLKSQSPLSQHQNFRSLSFQDRISIQVFLKVDEWWFLIVLHRVNHHLHLQNQRYLKQ